MLAAPASPPSVFKASRRFIVMVPDVSPARRQVHPGKLADRSSSRRRLALVERAIEPLLRLGREVGAPAELGEPALGARVARFAVALDQDDEVGAAALEDRAGERVGLGERRARDRVEGDPAVIVCPDAACGRRSHEIR